MNTPVGFIQFLVREIYQFSEFYRHNSQTTGPELLVDLSFVSKQLLFEFVFIGYHVVMRLTQFGAKKYGLW